MEILKEVPLSNFSSFRIGGPAKEVVIVNGREELKEVLEGNFLIFGKGTNVLFPDEGLRKRVIFNRGGECQIDEKRIVADAGVDLSKIVADSVEKGFSGLEYLAGIPGTLGGAIYGNAGAFGKQISNFIEEIEYWKEGKIIRSKNIWFAYRDSQFKRDGGVIIRAWFKLKKGKGKEKERMFKILEHRRKIHPDASTPCAGSFFKNILLPDGNKIATGKLLEEIGAKGLKVGGAEVFKGHANFIINSGKARAKDVLKLAEILKERARRELSIELEEEVIIVKDP